MTGGLLAAGAAVIAQATSTGHHGRHRLVPAGRSRPDRGDLGLHQGLLDRPAEAARTRGRRAPHQAAGLLRPVDALHELYDWARSAHAAVAALPPCRSFTSTTRLEPETERPMRNVWRWWKVRTSADQALVVLGLILLWMSTSLWQAERNFHVVPRRSQERLPRSWKIRQPVRRCSQAVRTSAGHQAQQDVDGPPSRRPARAPAHDRLDLIEKTKKTGCTEWTRPETRSTRPGQRPPTSRGRARVRADRARPTPRPIRLVRDRGARRGLVDRLIRAVTLGDSCHEADDQPEDLGPAPGRSAAEQGRRAATCVSSRRSGPGSRASRGRRPRRNRRSPSMTDVARMILEYRTTKKLTPTDDETDRRPRMITADA